MIKKIHIENFRSIKTASLPIGKITVLTGANNSGKSSLLYGLMVLQDFLRNPNQSLSNLFALPFINLGGFEAVKSKFFTPDSNSDFIRVGISVGTGKFVENETRFNLTLGEGRTFLSLKSLKNEFEFEANLEIGLPYLANQFVSAKAKHIKSGALAEFKWNGIQAEIKRAPDFLITETKKLNETLNSAGESLFQTDFVPIARNFTKPYYSMVPMTGVINTEDEIATMLKVENRADVLGNVNGFLDEIASRILELPTNGAPGLFSLLSKNRKTGQTNFLVNEGSGTNQLVTILAKTFQFNKNFICIDEPEIHLHPSMVRKLATSFSEIVQDLDKQFLISTHSEHFVQALLAAVANGKLRPEDLKIYHLTATDDGTQIEPQAVNEKGQIEGGLSHFYESELAGLKSFFKLVEA